MAKEAKVKRLLLFEMEVWRKKAERATLGIERNGCDFYPLFPIISTLVLPLSFHNLLVLKKKLEGNGGDRLGVCEKGGLYRRWGPGPGGGG